MFFLLPAFLPSLFMNKAVPVSFFHLDRAFGMGRFNELDEGSLIGSGPNPVPPAAKPAALASLAAAAAARTTEAKLWPDAEDTTGLLMPAARGVRKSQGYYLRYIFDKGSVRHFKYIETR